MKKHEHLNNPDVEKNLEARRGRGRPKGSKDKFGGDIKDLIKKAYNHLAEKGHGLDDWALENPEAFYKYIFAKCIPKEVDWGQQGLQDSLEMLIKGVAGKTRDLPNRSQRKIRE